MSGSLRGRLLVAVPDLRDPNFSRTVVLVLEHEEQGAVGLVLNRPSEVTIAEALPEWAQVAAPPAVVYVGGTVQRDRVIAIGRPRDAGAPLPEACAPLFDGLGAVDLGHEADPVLPALGALRVWAGYAGWGPGQLDAEIDVGGWVIVDRRPDDAFARDPAHLWRAVLRRQGGRVAMLAAAPDDPSAN